MNVRNYSLLNLFKKMQRSIGEFSTWVWKMTSSLVSAKLNLDVAPKVYSFNKQKFFSRDKVKGIVNELKG